MSLDVFAERLSVAGWWAEEGRLTIPLRGLPPTSWMRWNRTRMDDAEAVTRSLAGDLAAYEALVARYSALAHRTAVMLGAGDEAEDVVQEAFVKAYRHLASFRNDAPFRPWLLRIVANETHNLTRSRNRRSELTVRLGAQAPITAPDDPEGSAVASDRRGRLLEAVRKLPDREREAVVCRYFLQLSEAETAQVLDCPVGSVKSRTHRGLARLREEVGGHGL